MKILIAADSFKETLTSEQACNAIAAGAMLADKSNVCKTVSIADGGDGFLAAYKAAIGCGVEKVNVCGPYNETLVASIGINNDFAVIESAEADGIIKTNRRDGQNATTYGVGQLIMYALDRGCKKIIIGLGGSATSDCGIGALTALGAKFTDSKGRETEHTLLGLKDIAGCDLSSFDKRIKDTDILLACDVNNPLCGKNGAIYIYGAQKGISQDDMPMYENYHGKFAAITSNVTGKAVADTKGCGAAGGLCAALYAYCGGKIVSGIDCLLSANGFDRLAADCDIIVGGEGSYDAQTDSGKAICGVAKYAKKYGKPMIVFAGEAKAEPAPDSGITAVFSTCRAMADFETVKANASDWLTLTAKNAFTLLNPRFSTGKQY